MGELFAKVFHQFKIIFWGNNTWPILLELIFRTVFMYVYALFLVRIIGKRGVATLAPFEMAVIVVLGSVLAVPMLNIKTPLINGMIVLTVIIALERILVHLTEKNARIEDLLESSPRRLVTNGVINLENIHKEGFSREDLFLNLREKGIEHLGEVKCAFLETSGRISVWIKDPKDIEPGLSLLPYAEDAEVRHYQSESPVDQEGYYSCQRCGLTHFFQRKDSFNKCQCQHHLWVKSSYVKCNNFFNGPQTSIY